MMRLWIVSYSIFAKPRFRGQPFLFSMWACIFADAAIQKFSAEALRGRRAEMVKFMHGYRKKHGLWPHPAVTVRAVMAAA